MKLSVFLLAYNHERFLEQAVRSVLMQRAAFDFELVIGEDASTDGTAGIVRRFQAEHPDRIRATLRERNVGMHRNFIESYRACTGEYVAFLDGDDYWTAPDKLQKQVDFLDAHPECSISFHNVQWRDEERGEITRLALDPGETRRTWELEDLIHEPTIPSCSIVTRNRLIDHFPDWLPEVLAVDWVFNLLNARCGSAGYLPEPMGVYRKHAGGLWGRHDRQWQKDEILKVYERLPSLLHPRHGPLIRKCQASLKNWYSTEWLRDELARTAQAYNEAQAWSVEHERVKLRLARELDEARALISRLDGQARGHAEEAARLRARLNQMEASRGWRLVSFARRLVNGLGRRRLWPST
jgi:glycosyltransferase involved in cell wall biosynthesis